MMTEIHTLYIDRMPTVYEHNQMMKVVTETKRKKVNRFLRREDANRSLLGEVMAVHYLSRRLDCCYDEIVFDYNDYGKPILVRTNDTHFNISHSDQWVVFAIDHQEVGIDVETFKSIDFAIVDRFFSEDECVTLMNKPQSEKLAYFFKLWTLKESFIKAVGKGLGIPLNSFSFTVENDRIAFENRGEHQENDYYFRMDALNSNTLVSVCNRHNHFEQRNDLHSVDALLKELKN